MKNIIAFLFIGLLSLLLTSCVAPNKEPTAPATPSLPSQAKQCGGIQGLVCGGANEYCDTGIGACNVPDGLGTCKEMIPFCTKEYVPVCGCDGKTYGNKCTAGAAGVSIDYLGQCK